LDDHNVNVTYQGQLQSK